MESTNSNQAPDSRNSRDSRADDGSGTASRTIEARYQDPLDRVWIGCAEAMGLKVVRSSEVYASIDGAGTLTLGAPETLDADDCVAQMVFHEICHALVQCGNDDAFWNQRDWGLDNRTDRDAPRERATLRLQAELSRRFGLRRFLAPTTDYRAFFDALPEDPLRRDSDAHAGSEEELDLVKLALDRARRRPFTPHLDDALEATRTIVRSAAMFPCRGAPTLYDLH